MAEISDKSTVQNIIKTIRESEIPQIQAAARELTQRVKELEEHSSKLESYVAEIENLAAGSEKPEVKQDEIGTRPKARVGRPRNADKKETVENKAAGKGIIFDQFAQYTTPEGFNIRKVRR